MATASATVSGTHTQHPLAQQLVPGSMKDEEFEALCDDLKKRGQRMPIVLFEGMILDGFIRYRALNRIGVAPKFETYEGDDPSGLVISLNVLRRKLGSTQRAVAGARLNIDYKLSQDDASKRVGVSKVHINLVVQAIRSGNARVLKMLENPDLTRERLHEELCDCGIINLSAAQQKTAAASAARDDFGSSVFDPTSGDDDTEHDFDTDPSDPTASDDDEDSDSGFMDDLLGDGADLNAAPSAGGKVLPGKSAGGMPTVGTRPAHNERKPRDTPASLLAEKFKGLPEADQIAFMQITWPIQRKLLVPAGLKAEPAADVAKAAISKAKGKAKANAA